MKKKDAQSTRVTAGDRENANVDYVECFHLCKYTGKRKIISKLLISNGVSDLNGKKRHLTEMSVTNSRQNSQSPPER